jgi:ketosteroid isomerase-like protein
MTELWRSDQAKREVAAALHSFFEAGKNGDLSSLMKMHGPADILTKFDDVPPYTRQGSEGAFAYEQASFANMSDYQYRLDDLRIDLAGGLAIATFFLDEKGMIVNDYSFEGRTVSTRSRVTMLLSKFDGSWRIIHEHFSSIPGWHPEAEGGDSKGERN